MSWWHYGWPYGLALVSLACTLAGTFVTVGLLTRGERAR
jgi:hypothetical protein